MSHALYNEIEPFACDWLEQLIEHGHIAPGRVERRSITELAAADVAGPGQRHFFSGIGGWSYALRLAGVPDDADIWTGSCPCQPFSQAGRRGGTSDPRHLWPTWFALIRECRPAIVFGEQVAGPDGLAWLDGVFADLEGCGYACGASVVSAGGVSAPHARHRLYFVACADEAGRGELGIDRVRQNGDAQPGDDANGCRAGRTMGDTNNWRQGALEGVTNGSSAECTRSVRTMDNAVRTGRSEGRTVARSGSPARAGNPCAMGNPDCLSGGRHPGAVPRAQAADASMRSRIDGSRPAGLIMDPWRDCQWVLCKPEPGYPRGRYRPIPTQPEIFPLASGVPNRVGLLRGSGNAIVPQAAAIFIRAALEARESLR